MMPYLCDKIGDVKLVNNISETLLNLSEIVTPKYIGLQVIKYVASAKAPNTIKEGCNVLIKMTDEFGVLNMAPKEMIDFGILAVNNTNPQVRT
jgi:cytoskeleton-associated protein 5